MELRGWDYTGRNIGAELHKQFKTMVDCLEDTSFCNNFMWGNAIQEQLMEPMGVSSSGVVRTVKKVCENFGFFSKEFLSNHNQNKKFLSRRGRLVYQLATLEEYTRLSDSYSTEKKQKIYSEIKKLYEEVYCDALRFYYFINSDGSKFHPLRATLKALNKYGELDKWEWYLLNTFIRHDDNVLEEAEFDTHMARYRNGEYIFSMENVVEKKKGHQYIPQYFCFAGLVNVVQSPRWLISNSGCHAEVKDEILGTDFLKKLYGGGLPVMDSNRMYDAMDNLSKLIGYVTPHARSEISENVANDLDYCERKEGGTNILLYGVPGCGKSWTIEHEYCKEGTKVERLVFHPDYTYSDFIGQILPTVEENGQVSYRFTPGPFTNILREAYNNPGLEYILIIEEINRGNAPAIFGEVFQLLDRKVLINNSLDDGYPIGTSEYGITNVNIAAEVYGKKRKNAKVRIPSNLSIIGTMNTSDQNVFTLDTAFQRRWEMRLIENDFTSIDGNFANAKILDTNVTWKKFCIEINKIVIGNSARMTSAEDKRLGVYFVHFNDLRYDDKMGDLKEYDLLRRKESEGKLSSEEKKRIVDVREAIRQNRKFPEKVIKYLWDDAFKFNREAVFETSSYQSLEQVIRTFMYSKGQERFKIFKDNVRDAFINIE